MPKGYKGTNNGNYYIRENGERILTRDSELIEIKCYVLDCVNNSKERIDNDEWGLCLMDSIDIDKRGMCNSYIADFFFIIYNSKYKIEYKDTDESSKKVDNVMRF